MWITLLLWVCENCPCAITSVTWRVKNVDRCENCATQAGAAWTPLKGISFCALFGNCTGIHYLKSTMTLGTHLISTTVALPTNALLLRLTWQILWPSVRTIACWLSLLWLVIQGCCQTLSVYLQSRHNKSCAVTLTWQSQISHTVWGDITTWAAWLSLATAAMW